VKVRFLEGRTEGLEEWVPTSRILARWTEVRSILRDEERGQRLERLGEKTDRVTEEAIDLVLQSTGEEHLHSPYSGALSLLSSDVSELRRVADRAGFRDSVDVVSVPNAFVDRHDKAHYPIAFIGKLARAFAAAEPDTVTRHVELEERQLREEGYLPWERFSHEWLEKRSPAFAVARSWAGFENELKMLRDQVQRLANLCEAAAAALGRAGQEQEARRILRGLRGR
jgi:hypothetical protein